MLFFSSTWLKDFKDGVPALARRAYPIVGPEYIVDKRTLDRRADADTATKYVVDKRADADTASEYVVDKRADADTATKYVVDKRADADTASDYTVD